MAQEDIDAAFAAGRRFLEAPLSVKGKYPFNPDTYLGWKGLDDTQTVTGKCCDTARSARSCALPARHCG